MECAWLMVNSNTQTLMVYFNFYQWSSTYRWGELLCSVRLQSSSCLWTQRFWKRWVFFYNGSSVCYFRAHMLSCVTSCIQSLGTGIGIGKIMPLKVLSLRSKLWYLKAFIFTFWAIHHCLWHEALFMNCCIVLWSFIFTSRPTLWEKTRGKNTLNVLDDLI